MSRENNPAGLQKVLLETPIFRVRQQRFDHNHRVNHSIYLIEAPDWVNIVALVENDQVLMVKQLRYGVDRETLELPGGVIDDNENPQVAAERELLEETGFSTSSAILLGVVEPNPAIQTNRCFTFLTTSPKDTGRQNLDSGEDIEVCRVPLASIPELISKGTITHALVIAAFYFLQRYQSTLSELNSN